VGTETATGLLAVLMLGFGGGLTFGESIAAGVFCSFLVAAVAAYRWGGVTWAGLAALAGYYLLAQAPHPRATIALATILASYPLLSLGDSARLAPCQRRGSQAAFCVSIAALYFVLHLGSFDGRSVEELQEHYRGQGPPETLRLLAILGTALLPPIVLLLGILSRRGLLIDLGLLGSFVSLSTLRLYVHLAPPSLTLLGAGTAAILLALGVRKLLDLGPGRERGGFTAEGLFRPRGLSALEVAALVSGPGPRPHPAPAAPAGYEGGGGRSGGGGATDSY
jgi:hypothetical protein